MNNTTMSGGVQTGGQSPMSEKEMLNDLLTQEKALFSTYGYGVTEASCTHLRDVLRNNMDGISQDQFNLFDQMSKRGYYPTKQATPQEVQEIKQAVSQLAH